MDEYNQLIMEMRAAFGPLTNPERVQKYARYFKDGYDAYGVTEDDLKAFLEQSMEKYTHWTLHQVIACGDLLFTEKKYEAGSLAIMWVLKRKKQFNASMLPGIRNWLDSGVTNWAHTDFICSKITPVLLEKKHVTIADFSDWRSAASRWTRRAVPVTLLCLRKTADPNELLASIGPMMGDGERVVHQGLGWFLRDLWKIHPIPVEDFLFRFRDTAARLIFQYATEKMDKAARERFRRTRS
jgi:3-methyladenine DNA glycosylase AlkD